MGDPTNVPAGWYDDGRGRQRYWDGGRWTEHTAPLEYAAPTGPADPAGPGVPSEPGAGADATRPYDSAAIGDGSVRPDRNADTTPFAGLPTGGPGGPPDGPPQTNVLGVIALVVAAVGFVFACIPFVQVVGFVLLPIAFVLALVALFLKGRKWPAITGLVVSVVGGIVGAIVFAVVVFGVVGRAVDSGVLEGLDGLAPSVPVDPTDGVEDPNGAEPDDGPTGDGSAGGEVLAFGETMVWSNDVSMTVSEPEPFAPSGLSAGADQPVDLVFTITIVNGSGANVQPVVLTRVTSAGVEASRIFDVGAEGGQVGIPPTTAILPGDSITWREAYSVADAASLELQTAPSFEYEVVTFTDLAP
ncbi:DUF2510 domain-containing protein [Agromyces marinus]|uniref:DUF2510 domain-containing protein n=1 Tax=Agromyces marinus TaxID=1389020 RepID=A0ABN6Y9D5_9MICO|nr:DUF2510 domain-containing protein [Agromyces marinus]UIP57850.1 hypothetical protein DSM26151_07160 [Agromyces marinus]BDZ53962.1 hypothetical protein GCM10025870_10350 [Agromyces marinus]